MDNEYKDRLDKLEEGLKKITDWIDLQDAIAKQEEKDRELSRREFEEYIQQKKAELEKQKQDADELKKLMM